MRLNLLFLLLVFTQILSAQTFTQISPAPPFEGVWIGSIAFSDVNGDGHEDVLITGARDVFGNERISKLYTNDGTGDFTEIAGTPFEGVWESSIAFSDVNGDGHQDVLITGVNNEFESISKLYTNDGTGNFTEVMGTPFEGVGRSSIAFSDINGDGHEDVLITGAKDVFGNERISKLYTNDGTGNFTEMAGTPFEAVRYSSIAFSDVNSDGHEDVLITGVNNSNEGISKLYTNDGTGNFTEVTGTPFEGVRSGSIAFSDVNGDGHQDVFITGGKDSAERISKLYTNDGTGNFTEVMGMPFDSVWRSSIAFSDVNGDGHQDVLITGINNKLERISKLYTNDGTGNFTEAMGTPFDGVRASSVAFSDINSDGYEDVLITGNNNSAEVISKLYINDGQISSVDDLSIAISLDFLLFPNPSQMGMLYLNYDSMDIGKVTVSIYNINGVLIKQQSEFVVEGQQTFSIDIASLSKGNYFVEIDNGKRRGIAKFIVQ